MDEGDYGVSMVAHAYGHCKQKVLCRNHLQIKRLRESREKHCAMDHAQWRISETRFLFC
jgi:hypothetical protein